MACRKGISLFGRRRSKSFWESVWTLLGHLLGTAAIFVTLFGIARGLSWLLAGLDSLHSFPPEIFAIITRIEAWLIYADAVCGLVMLIGPCASASNSSRCAIMRDALNAIRRGFIESIELAIGCRHGCCPPSR
jgi:uncharacterized membrane protein HdeD (DUF308 family)